MRTFLVFLSLIWISLGVMLILYTRETRNALRVLVAGRSMRALGSVPLTIGVLMLMGSFHLTEMFRLLFILALLASGKGLYLVFGPAAQIKKLMEWWFDQADERAIRLWGIICLGLGFTVFFNVLCI